MNRRAFTLLEVLVVVIIMGALASIGLRTYFDSVERMRGAEARDILMSGFAGYQRLLLEEETISHSSPVTWARLGVGNVASSVFTYAINPNAGNPSRLRATRVGNASRWLEVDLTTGVLTKTTPY